MRRRGLHHIPAQSVSTSALVHQTWLCKAPGRRAAARLQDKQGKELHSNQDSSCFLITAALMWVNFPKGILSEASYPHCCPSQSCGSRLWSRWRASYWSAEAQTASGAGTGYWWPDPPPTPQTPNWCRNIKHTVGVQNSDLTIFASTIAGTLLYVGVLLKSILY